MTKFELFNRLQKILCNVHGHLFPEGEVDGTFTNKCVRCGHKVKAVPEGVKDDGK